MRIKAIVLVLAGLALHAADAPRITLQLTDFVAMPITGTIDGKGQTDGMLARINSLREEPGGSRFFVNDLNGPLYILDKATKKLTVYLDFNGRDGHTGIFHKLSFDTGYAGGLVSVQFDPDYTRNGRFYTVHIEDPSLTGSNAPDNTSVPGLRVAGYTTTAPIAPPGPTQREGVLIDWTDSSRANATFEGTAREILRVALNTRIHPLGALSFDPTARKGDPDWRVLYVGCGDGGSGESPRICRSRSRRAPSARTAATGSRTTTPSPACAARGRSSGRSACAIRIGSRGRSILRIPRTSGSLPTRSASTHGRR